MKSKDVREKFLKFFMEKNHAVLSSASLVPKNETDNSVLFNTAGVQPLVPFILAGSHPKGPRLASIQKCLRTTDIDDVGDNTHATFFEMLGNWSIGDYFKEEAIGYSFELLIEVFGLDPNRLYVTVYQGNENLGVPRDQTSYDIWAKLFESKKINPVNHIFFMGEKTNWWPQPKKDDNYSGPTGPDTEMFYDISGDATIKTREDFIRADDEQKIVEIWNDVFMEYKKENGQIIGKLENQNVDTGSGFERLVAVLQNKKSIFETDLFWPLMNTIIESAPFYDEKSARIIADHVKSSTMLIADQITPANTEHGYILRRLIRRAIRHADKIGLPNNFIQKLTPIVAGIYGEFYPEVAVGNIELIINDEENKFRKTLKDGVDFIEKLKKQYGADKKEFSLGAKELFLLFSTYGFPVELSFEEINKSRKSPLSETEKEKLSAEFFAEFKLHQDKSRTSAEGKFKGGLAGSSEIEIKYHTATHLLNAALRAVLGDHISQKGSNINPDRLRYDFTHPEKLTDSQKQKIEDLVNEKIKANLSVKKEEMSYEDAKKTGAIGVFGDKYGDTVTVYSIGAVDKPNDDDKSNHNDESRIFSREICGGPHVEKTGKLGKFKIKKEEAVSAGVRRIKAVLE